MAGGAVPAEVRVAVAVKPPVAEERGLVEAVVATKPPEAVVRGSAEELLVPQPVRADQSVAPAGVMTTATGQGLQARRGPKPQLWGGGELSVRQVPVASLKASASEPSSTSARVLEDDPCFLRRCRCGRFQARRFVKTQQMQGQAMPCCCE